MRVAIAGYPLLSRRQWRLYEEFAARDVETHLLVPNNWPSIPAIDHPPDTSPVTAHYHRIVFNGRSGIYLLPGVARTIRSIEPDIVLTHAEPWHFFTAQMEIACVRAGLPHVLFSWENLFRVPTSRTQRTLERFSNRRIDGIIAGSDAAAQRLERRGYRGPVTVAPQTGVDVERFSAGEPDPDLTSEFEIPADRTLIAYVGRFAPEKGLESLLDAVPEVVERHPESHFLIVGDGELADKLHARVTNAPVLTEHVSIVSEFQPYERMPDIFRLADVLVYPSRTVGDWAEQFGYAVAEAMACEVPVVTTHCGSLPYVVGDTGLVGPEDDSSALATNIAELVGDDRRRDRLGNEARERVVDRFSVQAVATRQLELLTDVGGSSG